MRIKVFKRRTVLTVHITMLFHENYIHKLPFCAIHKVVTSLEKSALQYYILPLIAYISRSTSRHRDVCHQPRKTCGIQVCYLRELLRHCFQPLVS